MYYRAPKNLLSEINELEKSIQAFSDGELHPVQFRGIRVPFGVYEQRKDDSYMVRIRCTGGAITAPQLRKVGELAQRFGRPYSHITTRQELQLHDVELGSITSIMKELYSVGLSTRGGGGSTIRNIISSFDSGTSDNDVFDVFPYVVALTNRLIAEADSWTLPRKLKFSFSSDANDSANALIQDLGFIAAIDEKGEKGFKVYVAGGMGRRARPGKVIHEFLPVHEMFAVTHALKNLFHKYGNRKNKHANRLRFLWEDLGEDLFKKYYFEEFNSYQASDDEQLLEDALNKTYKHAQPSEAVSSATKVDNAEFRKWQREYVVEQKQKGLFSAKIPVKLGDFYNEDIQVICDAIEGAGDDIIRFTMDQNIVIRNLNLDGLYKLYQAVQTRDIIASTPQLFGNIISCTGADTCKLGICLPKGLLPHIQERVINDGIDSSVLNNLKINISGCSNGCGQHQAADIGFSGRVKRREGITIPAYNIFLGANINATETEFAQEVSWVHSKDVPEFASRFLAEYLASGKEEFIDFLAAGGIEKAKSIAEELQEKIPLFEDDKNYYFDWSAKEIFSTAKLGQGECSAGLFDMIDVDRKTVIQTTAQLQSDLEDKELSKAIYELILSSARMLLVTRGIDTSTDEKIFNAFKEHFIDAGIVEKKFLALIDVAKIYANDVATSYKYDAIQLGDRLLQLYDTMDNTFNFKIEKKTTPVEDELVEDSAEEKPAVTEAKIDSANPVKSKDYRGVGCPMNFVKTKIDLASMKSGELLEILLDDGAPIDNVPRSVLAEGHKIISQDKVDNYWKVLIEKG